MKPRDLHALRRRDIGAAGEHGGERGRASRDYGPRPGPARRPRGRPRRNGRARACRRSGSTSSSLPTLAKTGSGIDGPRRVLRAIDRGGDPAGIEALDDLDELDHGVADMIVPVGIETVGLDHQGAGADQEIAEAGARADAGMAVMGRVGGREKAALLVFAGEEDALMRHEDVVEHDDAGRLAVFGRELGRRLAGPAGRPRDDGDARAHRPARRSKRRSRILRRDGCGRA